MRLHTPPITTPDTLAERLEQDIVRRGLRAGDRYLSTRQVQQQYDVSLAAAARAMEMLVGRQVLERRDRSGTFIGRGQPGPDKRSRVRTVHLFLPQQLIHYSLLSLDLLVRALTQRPAERKAAKALAVQVNHVPDGEEVSLIKAVLEEAQAAGRLYGVVAISCGRDAYRYLIRQHVPVVVFGSLDPDLKRLASIDTDYFSAGHMMAEYLLSRGHTTLGLLGMARGAPGDHAFVDGVAQAMTEAGRPPNALVSRLCTQDSSSLIRAHAEALLSSENRPTGLICRSEPVADLAVSVAQERGLRLPEDVDLVYETVATPTARHLPYPRVENREPFERTAERIGAMLDCLHDGRELDERQVVIPVEMRMPGNDE